MKPGGYFANRQSIMEPDLSPIRLCRPPDNFVTKKFKLSRFNFGNIKDDNALERYVPLVLANK